MADKPLLTEEELTEFLWNYMWRKDKSEARTLARRMLACDLMYEALAEIREETKNGKLPLTQWIYRRSAAALQAAEEGR